MTIDELIADLEQCDGDSFSRVLRDTPKLPELLGDMAVAMDRYETAIHPLGLAVMLGTFFAAAEDSISEFERNHKTLLSFHDRMKLFHAQTKAAYLAAHQTAVQAREAGLANAAPRTQ